MLRFKGHLAVSPGQTAGCDSGFEQHELVRPRREPGVPPEIIELPEDGQERVVRALLGEVLVIAAQMRLSAPMK